VHAGCAISLAAVSAWMLSELMAGHEYTHPYYRVWEGSLKLVTWTAFAILLDRLHGALERSNQRVLAVLESLDALAYVVDWTSDRVLYANARCRIAYGLDARAAAAAIEGHWRPDPRAAFSAARLLDARGRPNAGCVVEFRDEARSRRYTVHGRAIDWIDGRLARLLVATEVTERRETELETHQHGRMERERAARLIMLGEMASTLAHELNQPLAAIANYNRGSLRQLRSGAWKVEELRDALDKCAQQAERAGRIIHRVRDLVRRRAPHRAACRLQNIVHDVRALLTADLAAAHVRFTADIDEALPAVHADRELIEQALTNLCRNAIDAMRATPAHARALTVRARVRAGGDVEIEVCDTGCGVPPEVAANRFELFYTTREEGCGIGLHLCRSVLELHQSRLAVRSNPGGGAVFSFVLPIAAR
jgi:signal transduction histidine kinase